ncbi:MAG TPA: hypothetical protein O0X25_01635 [Methanocorpusculum sp.]|nr:hypothetical protein [Methanocorpusculum sp.]HJJ39698.1 hypothetical protein [Methanocorpusculum sp.]HJJ49307.1 hypothetical protein [Methanocorpusculum sp.]HJJ56649.1 hypothetical protein [Methanocorpusculum sp.]HJJ95216.1 hypothetical protein [Methanocorpusculum sp.]
MILHDAVTKLREHADTMGIDDCDLLYQEKPENERCQFSSGEPMAVEFGGRISEITTPEPFTAKMHLENMYGAPLKSPKTRAAAMGALNSTAAFLMLVRKTGPCNSVFAEDCLAELVAHCNGKRVYIIGKDIAGIHQTLTADEANLVLINGEAFLEDTTLEEIAEVLEMNKEILLVGPNCHGIAALLHLPIWCPYGT